VLWDVCGASRESRLSGGELIKSMVDIVLGIVGAIVMLPLVRLIKKA
jgi:hypothetical protein